MKKAKGPQFSKIDLTVSGIDCERAMLPMDVAAKRALTVVLQFVDGDLRPDESIILDHSKQRFKSDLGIAGHHLKSLKRFAFVCAENFFPELGASLKLLITSGHSEYLKLRLQDGKRSLRLAIVWYVYAHHADDPLLFAITRTITDVFRSNSSLHVSITSDMPTLWKLIKVAVSNLQGYTGFENYPGAPDARRLGDSSSSAAGSGGRKRKYGADDITVSL